MKYGYLIIGIVVLIFLVAGNTVPAVPVEYNDVESYETTERVPVKKEVPLDYDYEGLGYSSTMVDMNDWELKEEVRIYNHDTEAGTFEVTIEYHDGGTLTEQETHSVYIPPGESKLVTDVSDDLSYSTDWDERYSVYYEILPPTKITEVMERQTVTKERVVTNMKYVTLFDYMSGSY